MDESIKELIIQIPNYNLELLIYPQFWFSKL